jgi:enoyl-CoA hydratase/carnithine racemase
VANIEELSRRFPVRWAFERSDDGILTVQWIQGDPRDVTDETRPRTLKDGLFPEGQGPALQVADELWTEIARDRTNKLIVLTGHGGKFFDIGVSQAQGRSARAGLVWDRESAELVLRQVSRSIQAFLDLPTILIGAANGPATIHAEYLLLCDIVVAGESAIFEDRAHFVSNNPPGDGVQVIWPLLLGWNRGRDFLLTGGRISAREAKDLGLVREVAPDVELLPRCHEIARELLRQDEVTLRYSAMALRQQLKVLFLQNLQHALALEAIVNVGR